MERKLLVVQTAALSHALLAGNDALNMGALRFRPAQSVLPAVTCTAQASFRTAATPAVHGMVANGLYFRDLHRAMFWEQSSGLVAGERIWRRFRESGGRVGMLFWQQSLGEEVDVLLSPAPVHKHHGGMIQDCYGKPDGLYRRLCERIGRKFNLMRYWGPLASFRVGDWIAAATAEVMADAERAPQLLLTYLPSLDYDLQRYGPDHDKTRRALAATLEQLARLRDAANRSGYEIVIYGDYAIAPCERAVLPNRALAEAGLLATRTVRGMQYPDFHAARALAVVDHEVAHVYVRNKADLSATKDLLAKLDGVAEVFDEAGKPAAGLDHPNSGELVLIAEPGSWFAYPWWTGRRAAPDFASHVDIHNKPGFDPCELFFGFPPMSVSRDTGKVRGSHGRTGDGREIAWTSSIDLGREIGDIVDLASAVKAFLES